MNINATLIFQALAFVVFVTFCLKYIWPPIINSLHDRQRKIAEGLEASNRATRDLELAQERVVEQLREAKNQASDIIEQARKRASAIMDEAHEQANIEAQRVISKAKASLEQEVNSAKEILRSQVSHLAILGAEKILTMEINKETHMRLVENLVNELQE